MVFFKVHSKEYIYLTIRYITSILLYSLIISFMWLGKSISTCLFILAIFSAFRFLCSVFMVGYLKGNAIKIHEKQFPEIFTILKSHAHKLEFKNLPEIYLLQAGGTLNAFATRFARKNFVVLYSDILELAYQEGEDALAFIIGHELGHIKRSHVGFIKSLFLLPADCVPFLGKAYSRACEYTCDNIGYNLAPAGGEKGLLVLAAGKKLYKNIAVDQLMRDMHNVSGFTFWFAEIFMSHPSLLKRIAVIHQLNQNHTMAQKPFFVSPPVNVQNQEISK